MKARRKARSLALQALYEIDCTSHQSEVVTAQRLEGARLSAETVEFVRQIVQGVLETAPLLDQQIHKHAPEWPLRQMAIIDRNILRIAIWEIAVDRNTPVKVAINEAVELAKMFGSDSAPRFVNGVLGTLASRRAEIARHIEAHSRSSSRSGNQFAT